MLKVYILLGVIAICYGESILIDPRVVGGTPAEIDSFPYAVSVQAPGGKGYTHFSTGTILSNRWVLTTVSRLKYFVDPRAVKIRTGSTDSDNAVGVDYRVEQIIPHPSYDPNFFEFDMALLKLDQDIVFNEKTTSIGLYAEDSVGANLSGTLVGWGYTYVNTLKLTRLYSIELTTVGTIDGTHLDIAEINADICYSDVGGPFVVDGVVLGISTLNRVGCGLANQYVMGFDAPTLDWINGIIGV